ncbi:MAG: hypothetical protein HY290_03635 [Planctomycetia bacterium]|nr:hypothetical protein [Planctomycetia bacterium]
MNSLSVSVSPGPSLEAWQQLFLVHVLPVVNELSRFRFRKLPRFEQEEATAEATAGALVSFLRLIKRGRRPHEFASRLARFAILRVLAGRLASTPDRSRDVLSRLARQRRAISVQSLDADATHAEVGWQAMLIEDRRSTPADVAASRIDFGDWLSGMTPRRRKIARMLADGYRTEEVAERFNLSHGRISQMRREFEASWHNFQSDDDAGAMSRQQAAA